MLSNLRRAVTGNGGGKPSNPQQASAMNSYSTNSNQLKLPNGGESLTTANSGRTESRPAATIENTSSASSSGYNSHLGARTGGTIMTGSSSNNNNNNNHHHHHRNSNRSLYTTQQQTYDYQSVGNGDDLSQRQIDELINPIANQRRPKQLFVENNEEKAEQQRQFYHHQHYLQNPRRQLMRRRTNGHQQIAVRAPMVPMMIDDDEDDQDHDEGENDDEDERQNDNQRLDRIRTRLIDDEDGIRSDFSSGHQCADAANRGAIDQMLAIQYRQQLANSNSNQLQPKPKPRPQPVPPKPSVVYHSPMIWANEQAISRATSTRYPTFVGPTSQISSVYQQPNSFSSAQLYRHPTQSFSYHQPAIIGSAELSYSTSCDPSNCSSSANTQLIGSNQSSLDNQQQQQQHNSRSLSLLPDRFTVRALGDQSIGGQPLGSYSLGKKQIVIDKKRKNEKAAKQRKKKEMQASSKQNLTSADAYGLHHSHQLHHHQQQLSSTKRKANQQSSSRKTTPVESPKMEQHKNQAANQAKGKPALDCCGKMAKLFLFITNILFWCAGIALAAWGILSLVEDHKYNVSQLLVFEPNSRMSLFQLLAWSFITLGCATVLVGFCGCSAIFKNNRWILGLYIFLILAIFALDLATGLLAIIFQERLVANVRLRLANKLRSDYGVQASFTAAIDYIQTRFECCGLEGHFDYDQSLWRLQRLGGFEATVARTCCHLRNSLDDQAHINPRPVNESMCQSTDVRFHQSYRYRKGCLDDLEKLVRQKIWIFTLGCAAVGGVILLSLLFATCFCRSIPNNNSRKNSSQDQRGQSKGSSNHHHHKQHQGNRKQTSLGKQLDAQQQRLYR